MRLEIPTPLVALDVGQVIALDDAQGVRIDARSGTVWVTEEGDLEDHIVAPGEPRVISHPGRTVLQALAPAWVAIADAAANDPTTETAA